MERPNIIRRGKGKALYWLVGDYLLRAYPVPQGWDVRVRCRRRWGRADLVLDGHFSSATDVVAWGDRMVAVFARDQSDN